MWNLAWIMGAIVMHARVVPHAAVHRPSVLPLQGRLAHTNSCYSFLSSTSARSTPYTLAVWLPTRLQVLWWGGNAKVFFQDRNIYPALGGGHDMVTLSYPPRASTLSDGGTSPQGMWIILVLGDISGCPAASCELSNLDLWWMLSWLCVGDVSAIHKDGVSHMVLLPSSQGVSSFIEGCWEEKECLTPNLNVLFDLLIPKLVLLLTIRRLAVWYLSVEAVVREKVLPRSRSMPPCGPNGFSRTPRWSGTHH